MDLGVRSTYQFVNYKGVPESVDQQAGKSYSLTDNDVVNNVYNRNYDVKIYALMERDKDDPRKYNPLPLGSLASGVTSVSSLLDLDRAKLGAHYLNFKPDANVSSYLVGGVNAGGSAIGGINNTLLMYLRQYFEFEIGDDGTSLRLSPVTSNIDMNMLFFVEVSKSLNSARAISPYGVETKSGTLFYVQVKDSAPIANTLESVLQFKGKIGESHIFPIYSAENAYSAMFTDSDLNDSVEVKAFAPTGNLNEDYNTALKDADCDWQARTGVGRAINIEVNNTDTASANGIPAHSLRLTIMRRIDKIEKGKYLNEVPFTVNITGYDKAGQSATVRLSVTVQNSDFDMSADKLNNDSQKFNLFGEGYAMYKDEESERERSYVLDAYVAPDSEQLNVNIVTDNWLDDPDYTDISRDTDSFRLIQKASGENSDKYLFDKPLTVRTDDGSSDIAVITPVFGKDANHFLGIKISAETSQRGVTGVAYMRILDRSGNDTIESTGIIITIRITVLNAPPTLLPDTVKSFSVVGYDGKAGTPISIDVSKYVTDRNNDKLRLYSMLPIGTDDIHCTDEVDRGGNLVEITVDENDSGKCTITPRKGFYGTQKVQLTVADGDLSTDINARTVILELTITVVYDFNQIAQLNRVSAIRSLPTKVTTAKLFPDITDTYNENFYNEEGSTASVSADGEKTFNPGNDYVITALTPNGANVTVDKDADGDWQFTCTREIDELTFNVEFVGKLDYDFTLNAPKEGAQKFTKTFVATVGKNHAPTLLENFKRESGYTFHTRSGDYGLDGNGTVALTTTMLFADVDLALGDRMLFDAKVTDVVSPTMCSVRVSEDGTILYLTFNVRGETELTVGVKDRTGETVKATFVIKNIDRPEPSFMNMIKISYETYPFIWLGVGIGLLVLILFIILLIILLKRRKRKREELEAILVSEMELEEQMMRLAGGPGAAPYQSYGYLPPTMPVQNDPNLMLGAGGVAPTQNNAIGLNPGAANDPTNNQTFGGDSGVSGDSDM